MPQQAREGYRSKATPEDDVEGHGQAREGFQVKETEDDVEGHSRARALPEDDVEGHSAAKATESLVKATEDDVEGHSMLPMDVGSARHLANARESEIRRHLERHDYETEAARRPHNKQTK